MQETIKDIKEQMQEISLVAHEASEERHTRERKNILVISAVIILTLIIALLGTNIAWILFEKSLYTPIDTNTERSNYSVTQENESGNNNNFIGNGDVENG